NGTSECEKCHWGDFGSGTETWGCYSCHEPYPHVPEWDHGAQVLMMGEEEEEFDSDAFNNKCFTCHGAAEKVNTKEPSSDEAKVPLGILLSSGENLPRCYNCHYAYPHIGFRDVYHDIYDDTIKFKNCDGVYEYVLDLCWADKGQYGHQKYIVNNEDFKKYINSTDGKKITPENEAALEDLIGATISGSSLPKGCSAEDACHKTKRHGPKKTFGYKFCYSTCHSGG
ncbi:MAG: hypothetical protein HYY43_01485, partial [Deltaproteobacteria bacterium]|nr:hypothetical protein [Deltaproteobacteria bacterium]